MSKEIKALIQQNQLDEAIFEATQIYSKDSVVCDTLVLLSARYSKLQRDKHRGVIGYEEQKLELGRISEALLDITKYASADNVVPSDNKDSDFEKVLDSDFMSFIQDKSRNLIRDIIKDISGKRKWNDEVIYAFLSKERPYEISGLVLKTGFKEKKVNRILKRLSKKERIILSEGGWLKAKIF